MSCTLSEEKDNGNGVDSNKRQKQSSLFQELLTPNVVERENEIRKAYLESTPYPHAQIESLFQPDLLDAVKEEIKSHTKVNFKESDLFRVYQSIDMANLEPGSELADQLPHVMKLRELLYSQEWRSFVERLTGLPPSTLNSQIDCACNCHAPGCHLLCHDDVIGTRKVSYIIYLTEPDWKPEEGGSLELYQPQTNSEGDHAGDGTDNGPSNPLPVARVWPTFNSMAFFVVEPGSSFHAVQEVLGDRPRLSLQGWYHAAEPPKNIGQATLQQLKARSDEPVEDQLEVKFRSENDQFTEQDRDYLAKYVKAEYLTTESMQEMRTCFEKDSSVQLRNFLLDKWVPKMEPQKANTIYDDSYYKSGISAEWKLTGPAHKQRYLRYSPATSNSAADCCLNVAGALMNHVKEKVFESEEMARYLKSLTSLERPTGIRSGKIRRFRPGLDYTVAHYGLLVKNSVLDATMCFVYDENDDRDAWESGDIGGFECYIEADDDEEDNVAEGEGGAAASAGPADEYNEDDDTELLSVSASNNTLSLVYRDPGTMRFVKYVSSSAPSSRYDICIEYEVDAAIDEEDAPTNGATSAATDGA